MNKVISIIILIIGVVLVVLGFNAFESFSSDISRIFTGSPTDKTLWLLIGGLILFIIGLFGVLFNRSSKDK